MLDSDASFYLVPEFQSSRGARRNSRAPSSDLRFAAASGADLAFALMSDHGTRAAAAPAALGLHPAIRVPGAAQPAEQMQQFPSQPMPQDRSHPDLAMPALPDSPFPTAANSLDDDCLDDWAAHSNPHSTTAHSITDSPDVRTVTPTRPMRFTFAREVTEHSRILLPLQNLFEGAFDHDTLTGPNVDPRLARSRARARARLAAHEATLPPEARNLWCDDGSETDAALAAAPQDAPTLTMTETPASDGRDGTPPRRAVRHLTVTRRTPRPQHDPQAIHDPLQDHLHMVRDALYAPDQGAEAQPAHPSALPPLALRLLALLLTFALTHILLPLRAARARLATAQTTLEPTLAPTLVPSLASHIRRFATNLSPANLLSGILHPPLRSAAITAVILVLAQAVPPHLM